MKSNLSLIGILSLIFAMFIWASSFIALKSAIADIGPYTVIFLRMIVASLCFLVFIKKFMQYDFTKKDIVLILLLSLFEPCLYFVFEANALLYTTASQAGMITSLMPILTAMVAGIVLKEMITRQLVLGSALAILGAVWLSLQGSSSDYAPNPILGNFLEFCAMICAAGYTIVARYLSHKFSALFLTASQAFMGAIFFIPFFLYEHYTMEMDFTPKALAWTVYLGVVVTMGGYGLFNYALTKIEASKAAVFINLIPIFTLILAILILDEEMSLNALIASAVILMGVAISQIPYHKIKARVRARKNPK